MSQLSKVALALQMLESAEANIRSAKQILKESGSISTEIKYSAQASELNKTSEVGLGRVVEGVFNGQNMTGADKRSYPVPANYASKSKLVPGDVLKLSITEDGSFVYKQIGPVPRRKIIGTLAYEDGQYKVIAEGKTYKVLLASVTYFKAEVGDQVAMIVPELEDSEWGAIENVIVNNDELPDNMTESDAFDVDIKELDEE